MIDKEYGKYILVCDVCNCEAEEVFDTFQDAVDGKQKLGWWSKKTKDKWIDVCPECK